MTEQSPVAPHIEINIGTASSEAFDSGDFGPGQRCVHRMPVPEGGINGINIGAMLANALASNPKTTYKVNDPSGLYTQDVNDQIAKAWIEEKQYETYKNIQRSRVFAEAHKYTLQINVMSRSGATVKESVASGFPSFDAGYDEYRERKILNGKTDIKWWIDNPQASITKREHFPTLTEKARMSKIIEDELSALPNEKIIQGTEMLAGLYDYPRMWVMDDTPTDHPDDGIRISLQCSLEKPIPFDDRSQLQAAIQGLDGTDGAMHISQLFSGKALREKMDEVLKGRRKTVGAMRDLVDSSPAGTQINITPPRNLTQGGNIPIGIGPPGYAGVHLRSIHIAWSSNDVKKRQMLITGLSVIITHRKPVVEVASGEELPTCQTCLEDVVGEAWTCESCRKPQHRGCFEGWRNMCVSKDCVVTCPNCRAEVGV